MCVRPSACCCSSRACCADGRAGPHKRLPLTKTGGGTRYGRAPGNRVVPTLRSRIEAGKRSSGGQLTFDIEGDRVKNVVLRLARGHAAYELSRPCGREKPSLRC
jgi:hypothetical protein